MTKCSNNNYVFVYAPANSTLEKTKIVVADLLCDFVDGEICIRQIKAGLAHFLQDDQFFEGAPGFLFDESTEIIGMEAEMVGGALQGDG